MKHKLKINMDSQNKKLAKLDQYIMENKNQIKSNNKYYTNFKI